MSTSVSIVPGGGYDPDNVYIWGGGGDPGEADVESCSWPFIEVTVKFTSTETVPGAPAYPGQPYIPPTLAVIETNENAGWGNSTARSIVKIEKSNRLVAKVGHDDRGFFIGIGINKDSSHPVTFTNGLLFAQNGIEVYEEGATGIFLSSLLNIDDEISIERNNDGRIVYTHSNGERYTGTSIAFDDVIYAYAQGYQAQDVILSASIESFVSPKLMRTVKARQPVCASAGLSIYSARQAVSASVAPGPHKSKQSTSAIIDQKYSNSCEISASCGTSGSLSETGSYCSLAGEFPCPESDIKNDIIPPRLNVAGYYVMPDIGAIDGGGMIYTCDIEANDWIAGSLSDVTNYCSIGGIEGPSEGRLKNHPAGYVWIGDRATAKEFNSILRDVIIGLYSSLSFIDGISLFKDITAGLIEKTTLSEEFDLIADKEVQLSEFCNLIDTLKININGLPDYVGGTAWVINIETGATSLFLDYDYNSFMTDHETGDVYGVCPGGIHKLTDQEAPAPLSAIDYGIHRFGSETKKMIPHFYASVASTGRVILKLLVDGNEYEYFAMSCSEYLDKHKINIGKGIGKGIGRGKRRGKRFIYANPVIVAPEGVEIKELDSLEYLPVAFDRRK